MPDASGVIFEEATSPKTWSPADGEMYDAGYHDEQHEKAVARNLQQPSQPTSCHSFISEVSSNLTAIWGTFEKVGGAL
jgi:hypothetical protein